MMKEIDKKDHSELENLEFKRRLFVKLGDPEQQLDRIVDAAERFTVYGEENKIIGHLYAEVLLRIENKPI